MFSLEHHYEEIKKLSAEIGMLEAALEYASRNKIDEESVGMIIAQNPEMVDLIRIEAEALRLLPKVSRLPIDD